MTLKVQSLHEQNGASLREILSETHEQMKLLANLKLISIIQMV